MPRKKKRERRERKKIIFRRRACRFCVDKDLPIDYRLSKQLGHFLSEDGKLVPRRLTGNCAFHQRRVVEAIERARILAILPYSTSQVHVF